MMSNQKSVLIVTDDKHSRIFLPRFATTAGHCPTVVSTGRDALEHLRALTVDTIFTDWAAIHIDGPALTRSIRSMDEPNRSVWVVGMTADVMNVKLDTCLSTGMNDWLPLPINREAFLRALPRIP